MTVSLEARLQRLEDLEEIRDVLNAYGRTLDEKDAPAYAALFAEDAEWSGGGYSASRRTGIQQMVERLFATAPPPVGSSHVMTSMMIELDGDTAKSWCRWMLVIPGPDGKPTIRVAGRYIDELARIDGRWKFRTRHLTHDLRAPVAPPPAQS